MKNRLLSSFLIVLLLVSIIPTTAASAQETVKLDVPFIDQRQNYPTGCESVSAVMALKYCGVDISVDEFIDNYLPRGNAPYWYNGVMYGCDPRKAFPGNPRTSWGWGCYSSVISSSISSVLKNKNSKYIEMKELKNVSLSDLCKTYIKNGTPVILWATINMATPQNSTVFYIEGTGERFTWIYPLHCLVLVGYDANNYYFNDPMAGKSVAYSKSKVETAYKGLGSQAVVVYKQKPYTGTPFLDIQNHWARDYIKKSYQANLFSGTSQDEFSPDSPMTRAMTAAVLYRLAGEPTAEAEKSFSDVNPKSYYANAVDWAYENEIVVGVDEDKFSPDQNITREQIVTVLYKYECITETELSYSDISEFADGDTVSEYAVEAMQWAVANGIINGVGDNRLDPQGETTRAQMATILVKYQQRNK